VDNALATVASFSKNLPAKKAKVDGKLLLESGDSKKKKKDTVERL
jgi:hypothetical protein